MKSGMRLVALVCVMVLMVTALMPVAMAADETWTCPNCGAQNQGNFCGDCGALKPSWICQCGTENLRKFCTVCGSSHDDLELIYQQGIQQRKVHDWDNAVLAFSLLRNFSDAKAQLLITYYEEGIAKRALQDWDGAVKAFDAAGKYSDAETQILATRYEEGEVKLSLEDWEGSAKAYKAAGRYNDSSLKYLIARYSEGEEKYKKQDWSGAIAAFEQAGEFKDASLQIKEIKYQQANSLLLVGNYKEAYALYVSIRGYKDVDSLLQQNKDLFLKDYNTSLVIIRTYVPKTAYNGDQVTVTYDLYNKGNEELTDIRVKENISKTAQTIKSLPVGQYKVLKFSSRIGNADLKSNAAITYKIKGSSKNLTEKVDDIIISLAK